MVAGMGKPNSPSNWGRTWLLTIILSALILSSLEIVWRYKGFVPSVADDRNLWSLERDRVGKSPKEIVLIGSSRSRSDISIEELQSLAIEYMVVQLAVDSSCANHALEDLGNDQDFRGIVLCDLTEECVLFGEESDLSVKGMVEYRRNEFGLNAQFNRQISTYLQEHLVILDPYLSVPKVFAQILLDGQLRKDKYWTTHANRSQSLDYTKLDIVQYRANRIDYVTNRMKMLEPNISKEEFLNKFGKLENAVQKIQGRGGRVVFIFFPMGEERWRINEQYFPREHFWELLAKGTTATVIHYKDVPELTAFRCPDESHMDYRDRRGFTIALFNELLNKNIISINFDKYIQKNKEQFSYIPR